MKLYRFVRLIAVCAVLAAAPAQAQVKGAPGTVAVAPPPLSSVSTNSSGCTPINPCAVVTPALGEVAMPTPEASPQPAAAAAPAATTQAGCPRPGVRSGRGQGRAGFAGQGRGGRGFPPNCLPSGRGNPASPSPR